MGANYKTLKPLRENSLLLMAGETETVRVCVITYT